jgi:hypothetical protein
MANRFDSRLRIPEVVILAFGVALATFRYAAARAHKRGTTLKIRRTCCSGRQMSAAQTMMRKLSTASGPHFFIWLVLATLADFSHSHRNRKS